MPMAFLFLSWHRTIPFDLIIKSLRFDIYAGVLKKERQYNAFVK
jgi:hypothetical protein